MKKTISLVAILVAVLLFSGCSALTNLGFRSYDDNFMESLKGHTKSATLYRDFTTVAEAKATHFSGSLMKQYVEYTQGVKFDKIKEKKYISAVSESKNYDIYYISFYTPDDDINNLESPNSFWNVYVSKNGEILKPVSIKGVNDDSISSQWRYLVKKNRWAREYVIKFKKTDGNKEYLIISSFLGSLTLKFDK